ncbi:alpha-mannosidase [Paenibacillus gorillae]|uniref:alpha-mannosidase n=1 Tax=Paenibacillus gorillae TaxID=1243662 RepID=UPI0004AD6AE9|nr:glycoside hydrolase family 38 C-terminal domain-containing protein [Paenibacillus gorillae]
MIHANHINKTLGKLKKLDEIYTELIFEKAGEVETVFFETDEHRYQVPEGNEGWRPAKSGLQWGKEWGSAWFKGHYIVPKELHGRKLYIRAETDGVETFFWVNRKPSGIFTHPKEAANRGNHHTLLLTKEAQAGTGFELSFEAYAGHPCVGTQPYQVSEANFSGEQRYNRVYTSIDIMLCREDVKDFVFDLRTLQQVASSGAVDPFRRAKIENTLLELFPILTQSPGEVPEEVWRTPLRQARELMRPLLERKTGESAPKTGIIGHSHMDTAWLWTRDETIRKCARTYANVLSLMDQYPEYTFIQSSAFHAELMRRHYPDIFEGMKQRIAEGRWEINGGVWIESDCNLVSGESLIRQFLVGQRYTRKHFNYTADVFWLPDTFGYSAAIPQIMAGTEVRYFLTTKLSWNDTNHFPYDTFYWQGLDGTKVLTHFNTIHCWPDAETLIDRVYASHNAIAHKRVNDSRLVSYGFGDGGGGPQYEMIEMARRSADLEGVPKTEHTTASRFMQQLETQAVNPPLHVGELYFEGHRGTLTQIHQIKRNNRKAEFALRNLELVESINGTRGGRIDKERLASLYELLLINQFHDILPGTSIPEVHDRAIAEVSQVIMDAEGATTALLAPVGAADENAVTVWNTLSWDRNGTIAIDGLSQDQTLADSSLLSQRITDVFGSQKLLVGETTVPAMGSRVFELANIEADAAAAPSPFRYDEKAGTLDTPHARVRFDENGYIESFIHKASRRELRGSGHPLNAFLMGEDLPGAWDNWDIDRDIFSKLQLQTRLVAREVAADGPLQFRLRSEYQIGRQSSITQHMVFHSDSAQVDFETVIVWREKHQLLKVGFDLNLLAQQARHEVQFGHVERPTHTNTPYDQAMFEVCAHKWTDISENRFGAALLNDCKYGVSVFGSDIRLTLHKGGAHPDPRGDAGIHEVTYSLLPHEGGFAAETVIRPAYELNAPALSVRGKTVVQEQSFLAIDAPNVIIEAVKPAEDDDAYVIRLYEAERSAVKDALLTFDKAPKRVVIANMLEEGQEELALKGNSVALDFRPFEIKTVKVYV